MKNSGIFGNLLLFFGLGVLVGIFIAPRKGEETRKILKEQMQEYCSKACEFITEKTEEIKKHAVKYEETLKENLEEDK